MKSCVVAPCGNEDSHKQNLIVSFSSHKIKSKHKKTNQEAINKYEKNKQTTMNFNKNLIVATIAVALVSSLSVSAICPVPGHFYCPITADCELPDDCHPRRSLQTTEEEAPTAMPILSGVSTPTEMPILSGVGTPTKAPTTVPTALEAPRGGNVDANGCNPSAGYSWCPSLEECIRSFETDCPSAAPKGPTPSPTSAPVNPAAQPTAKPTNASSSAAALSSTKTIQQYHIAVVATLAASSVVVALVL